MMPEELSTDPIDQVSVLLGETEAPPTEEAPKDEAEEMQPDTSQAEGEQADAQEQKPDDADEPDDDAPKIDYDQEVPMPDGREATTLGKLKDRVIELERSEEQIIDRENGLMKQAGELSQALQLAGGEIPQELKEQMAANQTAHLQRESEAMFEAIPDWKDPAVFAEDRKAITALGTTYGLTPKEMGAIMDHRMIKFMHDHVRLLNAKKEGSETIKRLKAVPAPKSRKAAAASKGATLKQQVETAAASNNQDTKDAAVSALLGIK